MPGSPVNDEPSLLQDLSPHEYRWVVTQFLVLFDGYLYRAKLLPFLTEGEWWRQEQAYKERTIPLLHSFFDTVEGYFQRGSHSHNRADIFGERITSSEVLLASQLRSPERDTLVSPARWEDLASVISRVARNMHCKDPTWLLISEDTPHLKIYSL